jgi:hypothetical protein
VVDEPVRLTLELLAQGGTTTGFVVPDDVVEQLGGGGRPQVVLGVAGHEFRSSIARMGGRYLVGLSKERRTQAGVAAGDVLAITLRLDDAPRTVDVPDDLATALAADPALAQAWAGWSYTKQKEAARQLVEAKKPETRASRLAAVLTRLAG